METVLLYIFSALALASAVAVITRRNAVSSALFLVLTFLCLAAIYVLMDAFFLAVIQVAVYAGAIMVLFLFVIMLLNLGTSEAADFDTARAMGRRLPLVLLTSSTKYVLSQGLAFLQHQQRYQSDWSGLFAAITIVMLPTLIVYTIFQNQIQRGLTIGALKG